MFRIVGKHAIKAASKNLRRKHIIFFGSQEKYKEYGLDCAIILHKENFLQVDKIFIESSFKHILNYKKIIILDGIEDPRNMGSIIRSAAILEFAVLIRSGKGLEINETVAKCASGGLDYTPIGFMKNTVETMKKLKNEGYWIYTLDEEGETQNKIMDKLVIIIGSEGHGVSALMKKQCDFLWKLKCNAKFPTYNASIAATLAMYLAF